MLALHNVLSFVTFWVIVPIVLKTGLYLSWLIIDGLDANNRYAKISGIAGVFAGLVIGAACAILLRYSSQGDPEPPPHVELIPILIGLVAGGGIPLLVLLADNISLPGLVTLPLSAASSVASISYYFNLQARSTVLNLSLAALLGALIHFVVSPRTFGRIYRRRP